MKPNPASLFTDQLIRGWSITEREFREEVIYFLIVDRFHDATSEEEERQGVWDRGSKHGLYDKTWTQWGKYWGGNLRGIIEKIPYLKELGITAVWLSPLFEQVDDMQYDRAPMHGYWTKDFKRINPRFLPADESNSLSNSSTLRKLVDELHANDIKLVLDIVCNHSSPDVNGSKGVVFDDGKLLCDFNDDVDGFYHHNAEITDWEDEFQLINGEMCGLATFNESNPRYREYIKSAIVEWLDVGVDALRIDTIKHMPIWFWQEFTADMKAHKPELFLFGEYGFGKPWEQRTVDYANNSGMSILDFGLCDAIRFAFSGQEPGGFHLIESLLAHDYVYHRANELVTFIDNHDMPRFLSVCDHHRSLEQALILLFCLRGVPCIFYGTEQSLVNQTDGGGDPYNRPMMESWDTTSTCFSLISKLILSRRSNQALTFGSHRQLYVSENIYAFLRTYRDSSAICVLNKGPEATLELDLPNSLHSKYFSCVLTNHEFLPADGKVNLHVPSAGSFLFSSPGERVAGTLVVTFQLNGLETSPGQSVVLLGDCSELGHWNLDSAYGMEYVNQNTWICEVAFNESAGQQIQFKFVLVDNSSQPTYECILPRRFLLASSGRQKFDALWSNH